MIKKNNRIFNNLYGFESPYLKYASKRGDWKDTKKILKNQPSDLIDIVTKSGLRGRGGAGFSTTGDGVGVTVLPPPLSKSPN